MDQLNRHTGEVAASRRSKPRWSRFSEETMLNIHHDESRPSRVTVAFEDGALSFMLSKDATFEDLADQLGRLGARHHGKPVAIEVKLAALSALSDAD